MLNVICPICNKGIKFITNKDDNDIRKYGSINYICDECNKSYKISLSNGEYKSFKKEE